jgi:putative membrane protein
MALERAANADVKRFAQQMVDDHSKANQELMALASQKGMTLPNTLPIPAQATLSALSGVTGEEFDKCYVHDQIAAHIQAVGLFEAEAKRGQDPQLKAWAAKTLPALKEHLTTIKKMHEACEAKEKSVNSSAR